MISLPLFRTDNTEKLEVADAYDVSSERPINKLWEASKNKAEVLYDRAGGAEGIANSVDRLLQAKSAGASGKDLLEQGLGMFGTSSTGLLRTIGGDVLDKAGAFIDLDPAMARRIKNTATGLYSTISTGQSGDISRYGDLTTLMGDLTGYPEISAQINIGIETAIWAGVFTEANEYGTYDHYRRVKPHVDPVVFHQAVIYSLPSVATSGSVSALQTVMTEVTPDEILAHQPDFIATFLGQFTLPEPVPLDLEEYAQDVISHMDLLDNNWRAYTGRGSESTYDLSRLVGTSPDAQRLFSSHEILGPLSQIAPLFPERSVAEVIREQFPKMITSLK